MGTNETSPRGLASCGLVSVVFAFRLVPVTDARTCWDAGSIGHGGRGGQQKAARKVLTMTNRSRPPRGAPCPVAALGLPLSAVSRLYGISLNALRLRITSGTLPAVRIAPRRWLILDGDHEVLRGEEPAGLATVAHAGTGRSVLTIREAAELLGLCRRTAELLARDGDLPTFRDELGRRLVAVSDFRTWLRDRRKPTRWESQTRRRAS